MHVSPRFSALSAQQRAAAILDDGSFRALHEPEGTAALVLGAGTIDGQPVLVAFIDGKIRGGTIGLQEAAVLAQLEHQAAEDPQRPLILGFDTGGVRVEEGPRALAAVSAVGVALARLTLIGVPVVGVISGPRGCFGALAVMAALPQHRIIVENASWGLTGPKLLGDIRSAPDAAVYAATSAATRLANGDAHEQVEDQAPAVRDAVARFVGTTPRMTGGPHDGLRRSAEITAELRARLRLVSPPSVPPATNGKRRPRDLLRYSFRGQWQPSAEIQRAGLVHAALGTLGQRPALGLIIGPEQAGGVGIEEAAVITDMLQRLTARGSDPAIILTFLFCQGHAVDHTQERFGLHRALAECLRAMVAARLLGHAVASVLGGGTYGAAYLSLAAPSHRIFAMRGTSVAPMSPQVLRAFQSLRGHKPGHEATSQLAELIPEIRIVESIIRLPRLLAAELESLTGQHGDAAV